MAFGVLSYLPQYGAEVGVVAVALSVFWFAIPALIRGRDPQFEGWSRRAVRLIAGSGILLMTGFLLLVFLTDAEPPGGAQGGHWGTRGVRIVLGIWLSIIAGIFVLNVRRRRPRRSDSSQDPLGLFSARPRSARGVARATSSGTPRPSVIEGETTYYNEPIESVVRYRIDRPAGEGRQPGSDSAGWTPMYNSITGLRLTVSDRSIEVHGMGPFRRLGRRFGFELTLSPSETQMTIINLSRAVIGGWAVPRPKVDFIALSQKREDGSWYTLALRPSDRNLDRLQAALRLAGVTES